MTRLNAVAAFACALALSISAADAKPRHKTKRILNTVTQECVLTNEGRQVCSGSIQRTTGHARVRAPDGNGVLIVGGRPPGCPHRFCGCEASIYLFGKIRPELNLAANWIRYFPRTSPAPKMAAARRGHVMVLLSHAGGSDWLVHDGNSGGGKTRVHVRSIRGYVVVDPHGSRTASR